MVGSGSPTRLDASEYDAIASAMAETERGRRFLAEFARRHRGADTQTLLRAIARLERSVTRDAAGGRESEGLRDALAAMAEGIDDARAEIAAMAPPDGPAAPEAGASLEALVPEIERATLDILAATEAMQEAAWSLRETGADRALCDVLDQRAVALYAACSAQDLSAQRIGRAVRLLRTLETRIAAGLEGEGPSAADRPSEAAPATTPEPGQDGIGRAAGPADPPPAGPQPRPSGAAGRDAPDGEEDLALAFADLDRLSIEEKIALFS